MSKMLVYRSEDPPLIEARAGLDNLIAFALNGMWLEPNEVSVKSIKLGPDKPILVISDHMKEVVSPIPGGDLVVEESVYQGFPSNLRANLDFQKVSPMAYALIGDLRSFARKFSQSGDGPREFYLDQVRFSTFSEKSYRVFSVGPMIQMMPKSFEIEFQKVAHSYDESRQFIASQLSEAFIAERKICGMFGVLFVSDDVFEFLEPYLDPRCFRVEKKPS